MTSAKEALSEVPLFKSLSKRDVRRLGDTLKERTFPAGSIVTDVKQEGIGFFIIEEGKATVEVRGKPRRTLGAGDYFGEIAIIDGGLRSAKITADTDLRCYGLTSWQFRPFIEDHPEVAWALLQSLAKRVREAEARDD